MAETTDTLEGQKEKRLAILDAALSLFAERGFYGTAVPAVAERAGVGTGTIYRYFESKEALVNALYQHHKMAFVAAVLRDFPAGAPPRKQFHTLFERIVAWARENEEAFRFLELHHHGPYLDEQSRTLEEGVMKQSIEFYEFARQNEALKDAPAVVLIALVWGAFVMLMKFVREGRVELTDDVVAQAESCCWEAIRR